MKQKDKDISKEENPFVDRENTFRLSKLPLIV